MLEETLLVCRPEGLCDPRALLDFYLADLRGKLQMYPEMMRNIRPPSNWGSQPIVHHVPPQVKTLGSKSKLPLRVVQKEQETKKFMAASLQALQKPVSRDSRLTGFCKAFAGSEPLQTLPNQQPTGVSVLDAGPEPATSAFHANESRQAKCVPEADVARKCESDNESHVTFDGRICVQR